MKSEARRWRIGGRVQGVGFRPFVYRLAHAFDLTGWVRNTAGTVEIHAQGSADRLSAFGRGLFAQCPGTARARLIEETAASLESGDDFVILQSADGRDLPATIPPDLYTCEECLAELSDPGARRYRYPFINCTQCGPRYTIIRKLPYDRKNTTLDGFSLCAACADEYGNPQDRRFHAQPLACAACGPALYWHDRRTPVVRGGSALAAAIRALRRGRIVAMRGVGGYQLLCDAANENAVVRLRERKGRPAKPFAVMVPWSDGDGLRAARDIAHLSPLSGAALCDPARPIVIVERLPSARLCAAIAPGLRDIGLMLPYSPLHHLLLQDFAGPLVATSGNISGEPLLTAPEEAEQRLDHVADGFLHHNRPIARPADDAVLRVLAGVVRPVRLGRGTAPLELRLESAAKTPTLAVGAYSKSCTAVALGHRAVVSPHIGDQTTPRGGATFALVVRDLQSLSGIQAEHVVHDAHPLFPSTRWARDSGLPTTAVWHHHAHASAVAGEYPSSSPLLCFTWDGAGLGPDHTLWGGEALAGQPGAWRRAGSFRQFRLLGGDRAVRDPWRSALALCWEAGMPWPEGESRGGDLLRRAFDNRVNTPVTTSVGRLFDAAAALVGVCLTSSYEGEGPMRLEALCESTAPALALPLARDATGVWRSDWTPLLSELRDPGQSAAYRAARFHSTLAQALVSQACSIRDETGIDRVGLAGGVFQNRILTDAASTSLRAAGFEVLIPQHLPLNDAAISFGQVIEATALHVANR
jgi:hydrogenase maturation protein HypF